MIISLSSDNFPFQGYFPCPGIFFLPIQDSLGALLGIPMELCPRAGFSLFYIPGIPRHLFGLVRTSIPSWNYKKIPALTWKTPFFTSGKNKSNNPPRARLIQGFIPIFLQDFSSLALPQPFSSLEFPEEFSALCCFPKKKKIPSCACPGI